MLKFHLKTSLDGIHLFTELEMRLFSIVQPIAGSSRQATASCRRVSRCAVPHCQRSRRQQSTLRPSNYTIDGKVYPTDSYSNIPPSILAKLDRRLHDLPSHPIAILRQLVESHFSTHTPVSPSSPIVTVTKNFDELGFAPDHPGRSMTDSYYLNKEYMLRTHTSAHEIESYAKGLDRWLLSADVYRRDEIDSSHYPVFHQMEGTQVWSQSDLHTLPELNAALAAQIAECPLIIEDTTRISPSNPYQVSHDSIHAEQIDQHLKHSLNSLIFRLFGPMVTKDGEPLRVRWIEAFFPFTTPSYEVEVWWNGQWLELLGSGVVMQKTLELAGESRHSSTFLHPYFSISICPTSPSHFQIIVTHTRQAYQINPAGLLESVSNDSPWYYSPYPIYVSFGLPILVSSINLHQVKSRRLHHILNIHHVYGTCRFGFQINRHHRHRQHHHHRHHQLTDCSRKEVMVVLGRDGQMW